MILWGSGVGGDTSNDDRTYPLKQNNLTNIPMQVFIGGISADIAYRGRSQYPGVDQINVTIPASVTPGCFVSAVVVTGSIVSNAVTFPVNPNGGVCSDAATGLNGTQLQALANKPGAKVNAMLAFFSGGPKPQAFALAATLSSANFGEGVRFPGKLHRGSSGAGVIQ